MDCEPRQVDQGMEESGRRCFEWCRLNGGSLQLRLYILFPHPVESVPSKQGNKRLRRDNSLFLLNIWSTGTEKGHGHSAIYSSVHTIFT